MSTRGRIPCLGLNLHVYPSSVENASRLRKIAGSLQEACAFKETHIVGMRAPGLPDKEDIGSSVQVVRISGTRRRGTLGRILKAILWQPRVYLAYRREKVATIAAHNVWVLPLCARLSTVTGASLVYNPHELETETVAMRGMKQRAARFIERRYVPRARVISTVNESISRWYVDTYAVAMPISVTNIPEDNGDMSDLRSRLGLTREDMLFLHTGHLAEGRNLRLLLTAFAGLPTKHLVLMGDGPLAHVVAAAAESSPNIHWVLPVAPDAVVAQMREADVGICLIEDTSLSLRLSSPNKFYEALCAGTPSLVTHLVEPRRVLGIHADAWTVSADLKSLRERVVSITPKEVQQFRGNVPCVGSWSEQVRPLVDAYRGMLSRSYSVSASCAARNVAYSTKQ